MGSADEVLLWTVQVKGVAKGGISRVMSVAPDYRQEWQKEQSFFHNAKSLARASRSLGLTGKATVAY